MATNRLGRYEILGELGRGAMGVVYRARDPIIDRVVALKTINLALTGAALASFEERFFQEARSAGRLNHPNIVTIYDAGKADGVAYIAMEFLEGTSLREILDEHPPLSIPRILETVAQVARGLAYAHENGVVHRDIKPANVIVLRNRRPKITDFGIARLGEADGVGSERAGSPKYMSPEQIRGDVTLDGRSDVFSLGTVLYEMLTGKAPFAGETVTDIMQSVLEYTPPVPSVVDGHVPPELDGVVMRMLAKRPDDRYPSARSLFRELRRVDENFTARAEHAPPEPETRVEPDALLPVAAQDAGRTGRQDTRDRDRPGAARDLAARRRLRRNRRRHRGDRDNPAQAPVQRCERDARRGGGITAGRRRSTRARAARGRAGRAGARTAGSRPGPAAAAEEGRCAAPRAQSGARAAPGRRRPAPATAAGRRGSGSAGPAAAADGDAPPHGLAVGRGLRRRQAPRPRLAGRDDRGAAGQASRRDPQRLPAVVPRQRDGPGRRHAADHPPVRLGPRLKAARGTG